MVNVDNVILNSEGVVVRDDGSPLNQRYVSDSRKTLA